MSSQTGTLGAWTDEDGQDADLEKLEKFRETLRRSTLTDDDFKLVVAVLLIHPRDVGGPVSLG